MNHPTLSPMETLFEGFDILSEKEQKAYGLLRKVKGSSIWHLAIANVTGIGNPGSFRSLICQLKSQARDEPSIMKNILGTEAYEAIMKL